MSLENIEGEKGLFEVRRAKIMCEVIPLEIGYISRDINNRKYKIVERKSKKNEQRKGNKKSNRSRR